jgi:hypothetical protein
VTGLEASGATGLLLFDSHVGTGFPGFHWLSEYSVYQLHLSGVFSSTRRSNYISRAHTCQSWKRDVKRKDARLSISKRRKLEKR